MRERIEIQIPAPLAEAILLTAAQQELTVEEILESAIQFDEKNPYTVQEHGNRKVEYAEKKDIQDGIMMKYHAQEYAQMQEAKKSAEGGGQTQQPAENPQTEQNDTSKKPAARERKPKESPVRTERIDRTAQEVIPEVQNDGQT